MANMIQASYGKMGLPERRSVERQQISRTGGGTFTSPGMPPTKTPIPSTGRSFTTPRRIEAPDVMLGGGGESTGQQNEYMRRERELGDYLKQKYGFDPRADAPERLAKGREDYTKWLRNTLGYSGFASLGGDLSRVSPETEGRYIGEMLAKRDAADIARQRAQMAAMGTR